MSQLRQMGNYLTTEEAAEMIGTYKRHVLRLIARGKLPDARKVSGKETSPFIIPVESVKQYIAKQKAAEKERGAAKKKAAPR